MGVHQGCMSRDVLHLSFPEDAVTSKTAGRISRAQVGKTQDAVTG